MSTKAVGMGGKTDEWKGKIMQYLVIDTGAVVSKTERRVSNDWDLRSDCLEKGQNSIIKQKSWGV